MTLELFRETCTADRCEGRLSTDGLFCAYTLEPPRRADNPMIEHPAIPAGTYRVTIVYSPRFQQMVPHVHDVPGRQNIEIHVGNAVADTHGCVLVGDRRSDTGILQSRDAFHALMVRLAQVLSRGQTVTLEITDPLKGALVA